MVIARFFFFFLLLFDVLCAFVFEIVVAAFVDEFDLRFDFLAAMFSSLKQTTFKMNQKVNAKFRFDVLVSELVEPAEVTFSKSEAKLRYSFSKSLRKSSIKKR
jgi:hypothetical protein